MGHFSVEIYAPPGSTLSGNQHADSYLGFIHIVSIRLWTRQFVNAS